MSWRKKTSGRGISRSPTWRSIRSCRGLPVARSACGLVAALLGAWRVWTHRGDPDQRDGRTEALRVAGFGLAMADLTDRAATLPRPPRPPPSLLRPLPSLPLLRPPKPRCESGRYRPTAPAWEIWPMDAWCLCHGPLQVTRSDCVSHMESRAGPRGGSGTCLFRLRTGFPRPVRTTKSAGGCT